MNEILNYSDIEKRMKGKRIPSRRELHSEPWDAEQLRFFCERQKKVPQILARMGITFVLFFLVALFAVPAYSAEEAGARIFLDDLNAQFQTLRKNLLDELGEGFPISSDAIDARMVELSEEEKNIENILRGAAGDGTEILSDDVQRLRNIYSSLYSSYSTYSFARKDAERREASVASRDVVSASVPAAETRPNMGLAQNPPYSIEAYDRAFRSLQDRRKRLSFELFSLRASEKSARDGVADIRNKKSDIAKMSGVAALFSRLELELARVNAALQMSSIREGISTSNSQIASINTRAKQLEWMANNLSFSEDEEKKILAKYEKELEQAQKFVKEARGKNNIAERNFMRTRNRAVSADVPIQSNSPEFAQYYYTRFLLTCADDLMGYVIEAMDIWKTRYKLFRKQMSGDEIWALRDRAAKRIEELDNKLEFIRQTLGDVSAREKELLTNAEQASDARQKKNFADQAASYRGIINDVIERYSTEIPKHIFLFQRLRDEAGQSLNTIRLAQKVTATGKDVFFSILNTKLWEGEGYNFTVEKLLLAFAVLLFGFYGSHIMSRLVQRVFLRKLSKNTGAAVAIQRLLHYFILFIFILLALQFVNIPLTAFAFLGGALALGFGFGAQNFFNNIISGFILMFSSPFKVGDIVDIDGTVGTIADIGERATLLRTFNNLEMIIPNSYLLQNKVTNWTSSDQIKRETLQVGVSYKSDPKEVREILNDVLARHKEISKKPEPYVIFKDFGASSLVFELYYWVDLKNSNSMKIGSDLRYMIASDFGKKGVEIPFPQLDVHIEK